MSARPSGTIAAAVLSAAAFALGDAYAACLLSLDGSPAMNLMAAVEALPAYIASNGLSLGTAALATGLVAACAVWVAWAYAISHGRAERSVEEHGSAKWGLDCLH